MVWWSRTQGTGVMSGPRGAPAVGVGVEAARWKAPPSVPCEWTTRITRTTATATAAVAEPAIETIRPQGVEGAVPAQLRHFTPTRVSAVHSLHTREEHVMHVAWAGRRRCQRQRCSSISRFDPTPPGLP